MIYMILKIHPAYSENLVILSNNYLEKHASK